MLHNVWVNIVDFLEAVKARDVAAAKIRDKRERAAALAAPVEVKFFTSQKQLARYTIETKQAFPRDRIDQGSPLKLLLAQILGH